MQTLFLEYLFLEYLFLEYLFSILEAISEYKILNNVLNRYFLNKIYITSNIS